jgi:hypothetical protein
VTAVIRICIGFNGDREPAFLANADPDPDPDPDPKIEEKNIQVKFFLFF